MPKDYKVFLEDILEAIRKIRDYTDGLSQQAFVADAKTFDAVIRNLRNHRRGGQANSRSDSLTAPGNGLETNRAAAGYTHSPVLRC